MSNLRCSRCRQRPADLREYVQAAAEYGLSPDEYVEQYEGTYNPGLELFFCTPCYIALGCPVSHTGIKAMEDGEWEVG